MSPDNQDLMTNVPECSHEKMIAVAKTIWGEARGEPIEGQIAVACVIRNRVNEPAWWGNSFEEVCLKSGQFSCWKEEKAQLDDLDVCKEPSGRQCLWVAIGVVYNYLEDITRGADHYLAKWMLDKGVAPKWATTNKWSAEIGHQVFYKIGP